MLLCNNMAHSRMLFAEKIEDKQTKWSVVDTDTHGWCRIGFQTKKKGGIPHKQGRMEARRDPQQLHSRKQGFCKSCRLFLIRTQRRCSRRSPDRLCEDVKGGEPVERRNFQGYGDLHARMPASKNLHKAIQMVRSRDNTSSSY
jgi:hypothetical protein